MKITLNWLKKQRACTEGIEWFKNQKETDLIKLIQYSIKHKFHLDWANWIIVRKMKYKQYVSYAIYAAEQVIDIYEKKYPNDSRPREAIKAAKKCVKYSSKKTYDAAAYAANAAADAAANAADAAAADAAYADAVAIQEMKIKILRYGIKLLGGNNGRTEK